MSKEKVEDWYFRRNSLRLPDLDYAARHVNFVTIVTKPRRNIFINEDIAKSTIAILLGIREKYRFNLYSYCLMPDHFHALIGTGESGLSLGRICGDFKSLSTREYWKFGKGRLWQRQFFDHLIRNEDDFDETLEYIRLNPVKAGLVKNWKDWRYYGEPDLSPK